MLSLPDEYELIGLFESEPELLDGEDKPWAYNVLGFTTVRGDDQVVVTIYPPFGELTVAWHQRGAQILTMKLIELNSIIVQAQHNDEFLAASGKWGTQSILVKLRLKRKGSLEIEQMRGE